MNVHAQILRRHNPLINSSTCNSMSFFFLISSLKPKFVHSFIPVQGVRFFKGRRKMTVTHSKRKAEGDIAVSYKCDFCLRDVTKVVRIHCAVCEADLCPTCFSNGSEFGEHKNSHEYRVIVALILINRNRLSFLFSLMIGGQTRKFCFWKPLK